MCSKILGAKGSTPRIIIAAFCLMFLARPTMAEPNSVPNQPSEAYGVMTLDYYDPPFDPQDQDFTVLLYRPEGSEDSILAAISDLGIEYDEIDDVRGPGNPVTAGDLAVYDLLIVGWSSGGDTSGLDPNIIEAGITGRVVLGGHDLDYHIVWYREAAARLLSQEILFVLDGAGTGLIALGDTNQPPFGYLPSSWGITAERKNEGVGSETVSDFTPQGEASGIFDGLDPNDMCGWGTSYHNFFTEWGQDFAPLELGESEFEVVTIARAPELTVTLFNTDNRSSPCINRGETITYSIIWYYPEGQNHPYLEDVILVDVLAPGTEYVSSGSTIEDQGQYNPATHAITWSIGTLSPGAAGTAIVSVAVRQTTSSGEMLHNAAVIRNDGILKVPAEVDTRVCCDGGEIIYVKWDAQGANNGSSWDDAFTDLKTALEHAAAACQKNIWVAQGIYKPGVSWSDTFTVPENVRVYGGLLGYESPSFDLDQRNLSVVKTILSGHISQYDRNWKVVTMGNNSLISGCVVEGAGGYDYGGIYGENADFTVEHCHVKDNLWHGIYCKDGSLTVKWCEVTDNGHNGIYAYSPLAPRKSLTVRNSLILRNASYEWSGYHGIHGKSLWDATILNCVVNANGPEYAQVAWTNYSGIKLENVTQSASVLNCTIVGNRGLGIDQAGCTPPNIRNCILWHNNLLTDGLQRTTGMGVFFSCVMNGTDANDCITTSPAFTYSDPSFAWHLLPGSPCIDAGDPSSNFDAGSFDIDGGDRVVLPHIEMGADEVTCEDVWNPLDWDSDGDIDLIQFAVFANAWGSRDPNGPPADPNLFEKWDPTADLVTDHVIDMKDLRIFCDGTQGHEGYFWMACWKAMPYPWPVMEPAGVTLDPNEVYDPNAPYDPNDLLDPNDFLGMMSMGGMEMRLSAVWEPVSESGLTAAELEELIAFLGNDVLAESTLTQEEADNVLEFSQSLQQELDLLYEIQWFGPEPAW